MASLGKPGEMRQGSRDAWGHDAKGTVEVKKERMNRLVMNYFVTEGHVDAAREFARESGTATEVDLDTIKDRMLIRRAVQRGEVTEAMDRVNDLNPEILEHDSRLFFHLQQQRLIELIRQKEVDKALLFAQEYLAPLGEENPAFLEELERTLALLAFEDPSTSPVKDLLGVQRRQQAASELNSAILHAQCQEKEPKLPNLLKLLKWSQNRLDEFSDAPYPRMDDFETGETTRSSLQTPMLE
ncbi:glucose-induced degradation 8-like protein [Chloropicon roscoffensis]|uniref:Glucose-induced degradation 8-like protein n=2 Tax=Chloropicon roscoffensis TaxID=1461544 RepID=A0AAX4PKK9_9CHLO|mmetsp:Transcript_4382/g.15372  ORF Transcript_4382/g.15372 Transcript_4382/m.15372 type:complete len:241 (+) Transcript_4382:15-737(+)